MSTLIIGSEKIDEKYNEWQEDTKFKFWCGIVDSVGHFYSVDKQTILRIMSDPHPFKCLFFPADDETIAKYAKAYKIKLNI